MDIGPVKAQAEMREDIIGFQVREGKADIGNNGKSGASIGIGPFSVGSGGETFESWTIGEREVYESTHPTFDVGIGFSFSCFVGATQVCLCLFRVLLTMLYDILRDF